MRSDWESANGENGDDGDNHSFGLNRSNSIGYLNEEQLAEKQKADEQVAHYVTDQLERLNSHDSAEQFGDELEAQLDGA